MSLCDAQIRVTKHAHEQYCSRVEPIDYLQLNDLCQQQLESGDYHCKQNEFIHLSGVWWVFELRGETLSLITCYGRMSIDLPKALGWAARNRDRINLSAWKE